jgi:hypothetical protein
MGAVTQAAVARAERLEAELVAQKKGMLRERVRAALIDCAEHHAARGEFEAAMQRFADCEEHATNAADAIDAAVRVCRACVHAGAFDQIKFHATQAQRHTSELADRPADAALLNACLMLFHLHAGGGGGRGSSHKDHHDVAGSAGAHSSHLKLAARCARAVDANAWSDALGGDIVSLTDVGSYAVLLTLATSTRAELKAQLLENVQIKPLLAVVPEVAAIATDYFHSRYAACLSALARLQPSLRLDVHVGAHVSRLIETVRHEALTLYFSPFSSVDMHRMAADFGLTCEALEAQVAALIVRNKMAARIDSHNKVWWEGGIEVTILSFVYPFTNFQSIPNRFLPIRSLTSPFAAGAVRQVQRSARRIIRARLAGGLVVCAPHARAAAAHVDGARRTDRAGGGGRRRRRQVSGGIEQDAVSIVHKKKYFDHSESEGTIAFRRNDERDEVELIKHVFFLYKRAQISAIATQSTFESHRATAVPLTITADSASAALDDTTATPLAHDHASTAARPTSGMADE